MSFDVMFKGSPQQLANLDGMVSSISTEVFNELSEAFPKPTLVSNPQFCLQNRRDQKKDGVLKKGSPPIENTIWQWKTLDAD